MMIANPTATPESASSRRSPVRASRSSASTAEPGGAVTPSNVGEGPDPITLMRVVIIDEHPIVHTGVRHWIAEARIPASGVSAYRSATDFLEQHDSAAAVIVYDPESGLQKPNYAAIQQLSESGHRVIAYARLASTEIILSCLDAGAVDYIVKSEAPHHLIDAVAAAQHGALHRGPLAVSAMHTARRYGRPELTAQERRVLIAWLLTDNKDSVSRKLHISASTVRTHLHRIRRRYSELDRAAPSKAALFARAVQDGLLGINDV